MAPRAAPAAPASAPPSASGEGTRVPGKKRALGGAWSFLHTPNARDITGPGGKRRKALDAPPKEFDFLVVMDFEWTVSGVKAQIPIEIIEFPAVVYQQKARSPRLELVSEFQRYCRPVKTPLLSQFCMELTGIRQEQVDGADTLPVVLAQFDDWLRDQGLLTDSVRFAVVTWSDADCLSAMKANCDLLGEPVPPYFRQWINLKQSYKQHFKCEPTGGLRAVVEGLGYTFDGRPHCGLHDARNTGKIAQRLVQEGFRFWRYTRILMPRRATDNDAPAETSSTASSGDSNTMDGVGITISAPRSAAADVAATGGLAP